MVFVYLIENIFEALNLLIHFVFKLILVIQILLRVHKISDILSWLRFRHFLLINAQIIASHLFLYYYLCLCLLFIALFLVELSLFLVRQLTFHLLCSVARFCLSYVLYKHISLCSEFTSKLACLEIYMQSSRF